MKRQRDYAAEYARRIELERGRAARFGLPFSRHRARGHARPTELPAREVKRQTPIFLPGPRPSEGHTGGISFSDPLQRAYDERGQQGVADYVFEHYRFLQRSQLPRTLIDRLIDDFGLDDPYKAIYGGSP